MKVNYTAVNHVLFAALLLCGLALFNPAQAQSVTALKRAGETFPSLREVVKLAGYSSSEGANGLTVRAPAGVLTVFAGSPDVLWQPVNSGQRALEDAASLSAPVAAGWYAPPDAFALLGIRVTGERVTLPDGQQVSVRFLEPTISQGPNTEVVTLGRGVSGLMLYAPNTDASLLLVDAGLLALALPEERAALDSFLDETQGYRPLYFVASALGPTSWQADVAFTQGGQRFVAEEPLNVSVLEGSAAQLGPDAPASGVILLPQWVSLREPLEVSWMGAEGSVRFRR